MNFHTHIIRFCLVSCLALVSSSNNALAVEDEDFGTPSFTSITGLTTADEDGIKPIYAFSNQGGKKRRFKYETYMAGRAMPNPMPFPDLNENKIPYLDSFASDTRNSTGLLIAMQIPDPIIPITTHDGASFTLAGDRGTSAGTVPHNGAASSNSVPSPGGLLLLALAAGTRRRRRD